MLAISGSREALFERFAAKIEVNPRLNRSLVSYQANRNEPFFRWFKYKEGFSAALVEHFLGTQRSKCVDLLDPFAGSGASLFVAADRGLQATGFELMPLGVFVVQARLAASTVSVIDFRREVERVIQGKWRGKPDESCRFQHLRITGEAFSEKTGTDIASFRTYLRDGVKDESIRRLFDLACLNILESVSFTRKDGQYLRWDNRANRQLRGKPFDKGEIPSFEKALTRQLTQMLEDLEDRGLFGEVQPIAGDRVRIIEGSCLDLLAKVEDDSFDIIITSPPYCNRYDYTRTYALELAYLGVDEARLKSLRQELLTCTVENRSKRSALEIVYANEGRGRTIESATSAFENCDTLQEILAFLDESARDGLLNNSNVPRMVRNYFWESSLVLRELSRIVRKGGTIVMVNDNVQYAGEEVPVDLILSDLAEKAGMTTEKIWILGRGKGNSSQQMGIHGRRELRKGAYVWRVQK